MGVQDKDLKKCSTSVFSGPYLSLQILSEIELQLIAIVKELAKEPLHL